MQDDRASPNNNDEAPLEEIVEEAIDSSHDGASVSLKDLLEAWGDRSYGPIFIMLGFIGGTPLSAVPPAAAVVGVFIAILAIQMAFGKTHPWLPAFALRQSMSAKKLRRMQSRVEPYLAFLDRLISERLTWAAGELMRRFAALAVVFLGLLMVPFDAVPFAVAAPAWAVVLFGVAITARDGLVMLLALAACGGVVYLGLRFVQ